MEKGKEISKIVHYCWFGNGKMSLLEKSCMKTWKKLPQEYKIIKWDEQNFDIQNANKYVQQAYKCKKYAFVSDYVRLWALYKYGGVYMDTDMEVYKSFAQLLSGRTLVIGFESQTMVSSAFIACSPKHPIIKKLLDIYEERSFINSDGSLDTTPINFPWNEVLRESGIVPQNKIQIIDDTIFVGDYNYFSSVSMKTWHQEYTGNTYTVHHFAGSWQDKTKCEILKQNISVMIQSIIGFENFAKIRKNLTNKS